MRTVALGLLALAGCNQVFGVDKVVLSDGGPEIDAPKFVVRLLAITPELSALGVALGGATTAPLATGPDLPLKIQVGDIGGQLTDVAYDNGDVPVPTRFGTSEVPWRMVYTYGSGLPREVQWKPVEGEGAYVDLQLTPFDREPVPANTKLVLQPKPGATELFLPRVYTTNTWTETRFPTTAGDLLTVDLNTATTIAGVRRLPGPKDRVVANEYAIAAGTCQVTRSSVLFEFTFNGATPTQTSSTAGMTVTPRTVTSLREQSTELVRKNITDAAHSQVLFTTLRAYKTLTYGPSRTLPMFRQRDIYPFKLPVGIPVALCDVNAPGSMVPAIAMPPFVTPELNFQLIASLSYEFPRQLALGPIVTTGQIGGLGADVSETSFPVPFLVQQPGAPKIDGVDVEIPDADGVKITLPLAGPTAEQTFELTGNDRTNDYYEATLVAVEAGRVVPLREFVFIGPRLVFDTSLIASTANYAFEIRAYKGVDRAAAGDFRTWNAAQTMAVTYTQTFSR